MDKKIESVPAQVRLSNDFLAYCSHALDRLASGEYDQLDLEAHRFADANELRLVANLKQLQQRFKHLDFTLDQLSQGHYSVAPFLQPDTDPLAERLKAVICSHAKLVGQMEHLIDGDFSEVSYSRAEGDQLGECLQKLLANFQYINWRVKMVADGDCSARIAPLSERDQLGQGLDDLTRSLRDVTQVAEAVAAGDLSRKVTLKSDHDLLGQSINSMIDGLNLLNEKNTHQQWFKSTLNQLSDQLRGEHDLGSMLESVLAFLASNLDCDLGSCYIYDEERDLLELKASHALQRRRADILSISPGEGLIGQAAREYRATIYDALPEAYLKLSSSLGEAEVANVLITPLRLNGELKGVIELGALRPIGERQLEFIEACQENIAIAINSAQVYCKLERLLNETEQQRSELEAQTSALKHNEEELQRQQTQLATTNEELQIKTEQTEQANEELRVKSAQTEQANEELRVKGAEMKELNKQLKEKSQRLAEHQKQLEQHNRELTEAHQELETKAAQLAESSRYKTEFLANMSHELRTPLNSLMILAKILADNTEGNLNEDQVESASIILSSGRDLMTLINEILDLSKVEAGKMEIQREEVNLADLLAELGNQFNAQAREQGIGYHSELAQDLPSMCFGDSQRIKQILRNLIANAIKFTQQGSVSVTARHIPAGQSRIEQEALEFEVADTGIGIPADKLNFIFEAFQQVDGSTSRDYGGTGLGLTICREMAGLLHGDIRVESQVNQGSSFYLQLPLEAATADQAPAEDTTAKPAQTPSSTVPVASGVLTYRATQPTAAQMQAISDDRATLNAGEPCILVVEDDQVLCRSLINLARRSGHKCLLALDGQTALDLANRYQPQGILLDLGLPDIDGQSVLQHLNSNENTRHIPVHILSASDHSNEQGLSAAVGYLTKPVTEDDVLKALNRLENINQHQIKHVLLVEDDNSNAHATSTLVASQDVEVEIAADSAIALQRLRQRHYDCMVLDLGLPDTDGLTLLRQIEGDDRINLPAVIVYTGRDLSRDEHQELSCYVNTIVLKGSNAAERLHDEVRQFLYQVEDKQEPTPVVAPEHPVEVLTGKHILLADDDMRNIFAMTKVLKANGLIVDVAENGRVVLERLKQKSDYDLILMDIMMPEVDGFEAIRAVRQLPGWQTRPIIALTAKAMPEDRGKCIEAGASDYISKPVDTAILISMLRVWLSQSQVVQAAS